MVFDGDQPIMSVVTESVPVAASLPPPFRGVVMF